MRNIVAFDMSNLMYRSFYKMQYKSDSVVDLDMTIHSTLVMMNKYYTEYNASKVICTFDRPNWRKVYTLSDKCLHNQVYKGTRRKNQTAKEKEQFERLMGFMQEFETCLREYTTVPALSCTGLEADDILAGLSQYYVNDPNVTLIIVSSDTDLQQLQTNFNTRIHDPMKNKLLNDPNYDWELFLKIVRGDRGDNIPSAFPRVRETRIREAFDDEEKRILLMNEQFVDNQKNTVKVGDRFKENQMMIDLTKQPDEIKDMIKLVVERGLNNPQSFDYFQFCKYCNRHNLSKILKQDTAIEMLNL